VSGNGRRLNGGKTARGRFAPGNPGGPGRPTKGTEESYLDAFREAVTPEIFKKAAVALVEKATRGDVRAFRALADYALPTRTAANIEYSERLARIEAQLKDDNEHGTP
jgi:hypothetical protein